MFTLNDFRVGDRVELHPATDLWMRGARVGTVDRIGRKMLVISLDAINRKVRMAPENICKIWRKGLDPISI